MTNKGVHPIEMFIRLEINFLPLNTMQVFPSGMGPEIFRKELLQKKQLQNLLQSPHLLFIQFPWMLILDNHSTIIKARKLTLMKYY